jgi:hypothetical protein
MHQRINRRYKPVRRLKALHSCESSGAASDYKAFGGKPSSYAAGRSSQDDI